MSRRQHRQLQLRVYWDHLQGCRRVGSFLPRVAVLLKEARHRSASGAFPFYCRGTSQSSTMVRFGCSRRACLNLRGARELRIRAAARPLAISTSKRPHEPLVFPPAAQIRFFLLQNRQGKTRLSKWYVAIEEADKRKIENEVHRLVTARDSKFTNFVEVSVRAVRAGSLPGMHPLTVDMTCTPLRNCVAVWIIAHTRQRYLLAAARSLPPILASVPGSSARTRSSTAGTRACSSLSAWT